MTTGRTVLLALGLLVSLVLGAVPAAATPFGTTGLIQASGASPFNGCTADNVAGQPGTLFPNAALEPWFDVDPANPSNMVGSWQQDRWSTGGARGLVAGVTFDGGLSWTQVVIPKLSACSGNPDYLRASDPWVSFAPNGDLYSISLSFNPDFVRSAVLVNKSTDGGLHWSDPVTLIRDDNPFTFNDKESITADPTNSRFAYAIWDRSRFPSESPDFNALHAFSFRGDIMFSRTTNRGRSWEPARAIFQPQSLLFAIGNQIAVLPDGTLVDVFDLIRGSGTDAPGYFEAVLRSTDKGLTWSEPLVVSKQVLAEVSDPDTGQAVRTGDIIPDVAVDRSSGNLYLVWQDGRFTGEPAIAFSMSTDGGLTWSAPIEVSKTPANIPLGNQQAFTGSVHVASDGTVAVTYYDFRNNTPDPGLPTDYWLVHCHGGCTNPANWSETHVAGPFDLEKAPVARGLFVGDYEGLASAGAVFTPFFAQAGPAAGTSNTFFADVGP